MFKILSAFICVYLRLKGFAFPSLPLRKNRRLFALLYIPAIPWDRKTVTNEAARPEDEGDHYGPDYYALRLSSIPYERSYHWQHFFSIIAQETVRGLRPRRVLDAGCAMGFLVEQFWDRGVHCEGIDISEYAISQVRRDIQPYCKVGSLLDPLASKYDLITCIEVLEHFMPETVRTAVANLCAATEAILFSSTPNEFDEPTHYNVRPPIYWLELFSEFGFWPDARFDAGYITPYAMLLRKSAPPPDDFLLLYSEYIRHKMFFEAKVSESRGVENQLNVLRQQHEQTITDRFSAEQSLRESLIERDRMIHEIDRLVGDRNVLAERLNNSQAALNAALNSRAWRLAEKGRVHMRRFRQDWPLVFRAVRSVARHVTGRTSRTAPAEPRGAGLPAGGAPLSPPSDYQRWITENETSQSLQPLDGPLISVIVPVHQTNPAFLRACIESVTSQTYSHWELCAAITPDQNSQNREYLLSLAKTDSRIHVIDLPENGGISQNTNAALAQASGKFVAFLDHDDTLAPFALYEVALRLQSEPDADLLYSDHDYLDATTGERCKPLFKPDWSPSIMFSANYITHLTVLRRSLLDQIGLLDPATDGAQDWDLFLRASEKTNRIVHIAKVLYHWRMHPASTAHNDSAKNYAAGAQLLALSRHMQRLGMDAKPEVMPNGLLHVHFNHPPTGKVSIIIPTRDRLDLLERCISTLLSVTQYPDFAVIIVDNGSVEAATKEYFQSLASDPRIRILWHPGPFNYSTVNNRAAREATGDFLVFLNNDVEITHPDWLTELVSWANLPAVGIVGAKLLRANGTIQHAGVILGMNGFADHPFADGPALTFGLAGSTGWYRDFLAVTGACMAMRHAVFNQIGGFDENFVLCGSDVEICLRAHDRGFRVVLNPFAELIHHERQTRGTAIPPSDFVESLKHYQRWIVSGDPYWNPNLSPWCQQPGFLFRKQLSVVGKAEEHIQSLQSSIRPPVHTDEDVWVKWFDCSPAQFQALRGHNRKIAGARAIKHLIWFISPFEVPFYGGIYTILRLCDYWHREHGVAISFAVCGAADRLKTASLIRQVYPAVQDDQVFVLENVRQAADLPTADATICTLWTTPYFALHHQNVGRRFYLIQDYEPAFYPAGSVSALVESTYRMGLYGIANTISLQRMYESEYGGKATYFTPRINAEVFHPAAPAPPNPLRPLQVFCYGRPKHPRNAFELVKQAMCQLKAKMGDRVRIVSAGDEWQPSEYGLQGIVENLGLLSYEDTARLYQESQVGVVMMLTRHPSYIPLELMACGCVAVTNINLWTSWLLRDGDNCLLAPATATGISDTVERALLNAPLREKIRSTALAMVRSEYLDWSSEANHIFNYLSNPEAALRLPAAIGTAALSFRPVTTA